MTSDDPDRDPTLPARAIRTFIQGLAAAIRSLPEAEQRRFLNELQEQTKGNRDDVPPRLWLPVVSLQRSFFQELAQSLVDGPRRGHKSR